jgi:hypothetical protein
LLQPTPLPAAQQPSRRSPQQRPPSKTRKAAALPNGSAASAVFGGDGPPELWNFGRSPRVRLGIAWCRVQDLESIADECSPLPGEDEAAARRHHLGSTASSVRGLDVRAEYDVVNDRWRYRGAGHTTARRLRDLAYGGQTLLVQSHFALLNRLAEGSPDALASGSGQCFLVNAHRCPDGIPADHRCVDVTHGTVKVAAQTSPHAAGTIASGAGGMLPLSRVMVSECAAESMPVLRDFLPFPDCNVDLYAIFPRCLSGRWFASMPSMVAMRSRRRSGGRASSSASPLLAEDGGNDDDDDAQRDAADRNHKTEFDDTDVITTSGASSSAQRSRGASPSIGKPVSAAKQQPVVGF